MINSGVEQAIHLLKQENVRLKNRIEILEEENQALQSYLQGLSALYEGTLNLVQQDNLLRLLDEILYQALAITNADHGSLLLVDDETAELVFVLVHGELRQSLEGYRMPLQRGIAGSAIKQRKPIIVNQTRFDPRFSDEVDRAFGIKSHKILAVPMMAGDKVLGVIELVNKRDGADFAESDAMLLSLLALFAANSLEQLNRQLEREEQLAS